MREIPDKSIDLVITDPPYNISYESNHRDIKFNNTWDTNFDIIPYFNEMERVLSSDGCIYMFGRWDSKLPKKPDGCLVWDKMDMGMGDLKFWSQSYEFIFIFKNGNAGFNFKKRPSGMLRYYKPQNFSQSSAGNDTLDMMIHPTQKPVDLISHIISYHTPNIILDPFIGSGTTAVAAVRMGHQFIGFEKEVSYFEKAQVRIKKAQEQGKIGSWFE
jgi:site-specific DNA-methyltransferase (adenine-specific)